MRVASDAGVTTFPSFSAYSHDSRPALSLNTQSVSVNMAGAGSPYIKNEPDDIQYGSDHYMNQNEYNMHHQQQFGRPIGTSQASVNPSDLTMSGNLMNTFGSQNPSSNFTTGSSAFADDELLDLCNFEEGSGQQGFNDFDQGNMANQQNYFHNGNAAQINQANQINQMYSNTPDNEPIQSPFVHGFNYNQFQPMTSQRPGFANVPSSMANGSMAMDARARDSGQFQSQPIMTNQFNHRHQKSVSSQWENTPGSAQSWVDSPVPSPHSGMHHAQISEVLTSGKHASLPTKVDPGAATAPVPAFQSQEAKRRRRRESHNLVERRRRDNINERIHDLSRLVPQHRLEDEKVRKHIHNNGPLSPTIAASGISPPQATSLLAGGTGRRAAGNITQGLPIEEKDKGPNKGDILNGAVGWTRDLMWMLYRKFEQEEQLVERIQELGGDVPIEHSEEEKRMRTELIDAVQKNGAGNFHYSRGPGSGLRVPKHTNYAGEPLPNPISPQSLSPAIQSGGSGNSTGGNDQPQFWMNQQSTSSSRNSFALKEEDEYGMDMG